MPKEIEKRPTSFKQKIVCLRVDLAELLTLLENLGVKGKDVYGISNGAEFEGLDDIKSAPARFAGEPFLKIEVDLGCGNSAHANIEFRKKNTVVSGGQHRGYDNNYCKENDALAKHVYAELQPFSNKWESWASLIASASLHLFRWGIAVFGFYILWNLLTNSESRAFETMAPLSGWMIGGYLLSVPFYWLLRRRQPVAYNPRATFWQHYGGAVVGGMFVILGPLLSGFLVWYLSK